MKRKVSGSLLLIALLCVASVTYAGTAAVMPTVNAPVGIVMMTNGTAVQPGNQSASAQIAEATVTSTPELAVQTNIANSASTIAGNVGIPQPAPEAVARNGSNENPANNPIAASVARKKAVHREIDRP